LCSHRSSAHASGTRHILWTDTIFIHLNAQISVACASLLGSDNRIKNVFVKLRLGHPIIERVGKSC
jgi:hypothetical protein